MMVWNDHNMGWWGWAGMGIGMVLFWALVIAGIIALVVYTTGDRRDRQIPRTGSRRPRQNRYWPPGSRTARSAKANFATGWLCCAITPICDETWYKAGKFRS